MKKITIILMSVLIFISCNKESREDFSFQREDYFGDEIKLDGYYYSKYDNSSYLVFWLYRNGIYYGGYMHPGTNLNELEINLTSYISEERKELVYDWGVFKVISGNKIIIEKWESGTGGKYPVYEFKGDIINDTTMFFEEDLYDTVHFKQFLPKPDSTNSYIN